VTEGEVLPLPEQGGRGGRGDETDATWTALLAELGIRGWDPLHTLVVQTEQVRGQTVRNDPVTRGGTRLLNEAAVAIRTAPRTIGR
jgi:hypothetical protein